MATNLNGTQAYRFELFEPQQAMPAPKKREVPVGPQRVIKAPEKTKEEKQAEAKEINRRIAVILSVAVVMFMLLGINMYSRTRLTVLAKETASIQTSIAEEQSRTVDLQSRLTQKMSTDAILDYATNRLGMVKGNRSQINRLFVWHGGGARPAGYAGRAVRAGHRHGSTFPSDGPRRPLHLCAVRRWCRSFDLF